MRTLLLLAAILFFLLSLTCFAAAASIDKKKPRKPVAVEDDVPEARERPVQNQEATEPKRKRRSPVTQNRDADFWEPKVIDCESDGNPTAYNRSTASGLYGILKSTWAGHGGFSEARFAPVEIQREKFILLFSKSRLSPWLADPRAAACLRRVAS